MENLDAILGLQKHLTEIILMLVLCSMRIEVAFLIIPTMNDQIVQGVNRTAISLLLGSFVAYGQSMKAVEALSFFTIFAIIFKEALLGLIFGFSASTVFWVAGNMGYLIDDLSGFNNVQVSNPMRNDTSTPTSALLLQLTVTAFWCLGGMMFLLGALYQSFQWWPVLNTQPDGLPILESFVLTYTDSLMQMTVKLAAPAMLILVMVDLSFGFLAKGAEKIDTMSLSMPVKGAVTLLLLAIFVSVFIQQVRPQLSLRGISEKINVLRNQGINTAKNTHHPA